MNENEWDPDDASPSHGDLPTPTEARDRIREMAALTLETRAARQGYWVPLLVMGLLLLGAGPIYGGGVTAAAGTSTLCSRGPCAVSPAVTITHGASGILPYFPVSMFGGNPEAEAIYWIIALPVAYGVIAWWYRRRASRRGVATRPGVFVISGLALLGFLFLVSPGDPLVRGMVGASVSTIVGEMELRGLEPVLTVAIGLLVLSRLERSWALGLFSTIFFALALLVNLYDLQNLPRPMGITTGNELGLLVAAAVLLLGGVASARRVRLRR